VCQKISVACEDWRQIVFLHEKRKRSLLCRGDAWGQSISTKTRVKVFYRPVEAAVHWARLSRFEQRIQALAGDMNRLPERPRLARWSKLRLCAYRIYDAFLFDPFERSAHPTADSRVKRSVLRKFFCSLRSRGFDSCLARPLREISVISQYLEFYFFP